MHELASYLNKLWFGLLFVKNRQRKDVVRGRCGSFPNLNRDIVVVSAKKDWEKAKRMKFPSALDNWAPVFAI